MTKRLMLMRFRAIRLIAHLLVSAWIGSAAAVSPALGGNVSAQARRVDRARVTQGVLRAS